MDKLNIKNKKNEKKIENKKFLSSEKKNRNNIEYKNKLKNSGEKK